MTTATTEALSSKAARPADLGQALEACDFAVLIEKVPDGTVVLVNQEAAGLLGVPAERLIGRHSQELLSPVEAEEQMLAAFAAGVVDGVRARREVSRNGDELVPVTVWMRAIDLDGERVVVSLVVPVADVPRLGRDPAGPWRDLAPVAVGTLDANWHIERVSADVRSVLGGHPLDIAGVSLLDLVHPDDVGRLVEGRARSMLRAVLCASVRMRHQSGAWVQVCVLTAPRTGEDAAGVLFALLGPGEPVAQTPPSRIADLELRLRRIGAEVRAAGLLDVVESLPATNDHPALAELTSRQWEILTRLLHGERVAAIASGLYLSPSTVRAHLAAIFRKFGVHSQPELLDLLRRQS